MMPLVEEFGRETRIGTGPAMEAIAATPFRIPAQIVDGMRWTLWLSLLALPFSYATSFLLARIGPEALGAFGVLSIYTGVVFVFFFLGGCAVPMKFLPEIVIDRRSSFLASYSLILLAALVPWLLLLTLQPGLLHFLFGKGGDPVFELRLVYLSPVYLAYALLISSLKGLMEMKWAQILDRGITLGLAAVLLVIVSCNHAWLKQHAAATVWLTYLALSFAVAVASFCRLRSIGSLAGRPRFWLPPRFWTYTLLLQSSSVLNFLSTRLDYVLVLNAGSLSDLGRYVAITSIAAIVPRVSGFVVDSLLPSLTNSLAAGDMQSADKVAEMYQRLMLPAALCLSLAVVVFVRPVLTIMGRQYLELAALVQIAALVAAVQSMNGFNSAVFTATDRVQHDIVARLVRTLVFAGSFWLLWARMRLGGAVVSWGLGEVAYQAASLYLLHRAPRLKAPMLKSYAGFLAALVFAALPARYGLRAEYVTGALLMGLPLLVFLIIARYTAGEVRELIHLVMKTPKEMAGA